MPALNKEVLEFATLAKQLLATLRAPGAIVDSDLQQLWVHLADHRAVFRARFPRGAPEVEPPMRLPEWQPDAAGSGTPPQIIREFVRHMRLLTECLRSGMALNHTEQQVVDTVSLLCESELIAHQSRRLLRNPPF